MANWREALNRYPNVKFFQAQVTEAYRSFDGMLDRAFEIRKMLRVEGPTIEFGEHEGGYRWPGRC